MTSILTEFAVGIRAKNVKIKPILHPASTRRSIWNSFGHGVAAGGRNEYARFNKRRMGVGHPACGAVPLLLFLSRSLSLPLYNSSLRIAAHLSCIKRSPPPTRERERERQESQEERRDIGRRTGGRTTLDRSRRDQVKSSSTRRSFDAKTDWQKHSRESQFSRLLQH